VLSSGCFVHAGTPVNIFVIIITPLKHGERLFPVMILLIAGAIMFLIAGNSNTWASETGAGNRRRLYLREDLTPEFLIAGQNPGKRWAAGKDYSS